ncbi:MAG: 23S rRNA (uracil(1939)-C(5))-methyltransferase RlmD [Clostridia bacterium]|nr:23S rRNA (uracil(1939)-C(5))-methyltransferase RlmD [Clostridia bacterium]
MSSQRPQKNEIYTLKIEEINNLGAGVSHLSDGMVVFVNGAVTGDVVEVKLIKVNKTWCAARLEKIIEPSPIRLSESFCSAPLSCGGCVYRHVTYEHELELKKSYVKHAFIKAGLPEVEVEDVLTTGQIEGYRNKAQYPVGSTKNGITAGFYAGKTHNIVKADDCSLQPAIFGEILRFVCDFATKNKISAYDEECGKGLLRHVYLRQGKNTDQIMLCLVLNGESLTCETDFIKQVMNKFPQIKSIMLNVNKKNTNVVLGRDFRCIYGNPYIEDILCGKRFRISAGSFYQVNHDGCELLYRTAHEKAEFEGGETVYDLYCGIGTIGLSMSDKVGRIVGIEIVDEAAECARLNAKLNGVENAFYFCGDASSAEKMLDSAKAELGDIVPDAVILDPPRKGSTPELLEYVSRLGVEKILYISCDPDTLARDCAILSHLGYSIGAVTPVDMFPRTGHCECVVKILRNK